MTGLISKDRAMLIGMSIIEFLAVVTVLYIVLIETLFYSYSVYFADDYALAVYLSEYSNSANEIVGTAFRYMIDEWLRMEGSYFGNMNSALFCPLIWGGYPLMRFIMASNVFLFFGSLIFFIWVITSVGKVRTHSICVIIAIVVFALTAYNTYPGFFDWYSGTTTYATGLSFMLIALALYIINIKKESLYLSIILNILGFLSMGSHLPVPYIGFYTLLIIIIYKSIKNKKIKKEDMVSVLIWSVGVALSTLAPGNFERHDDIVLEYGINDAISQSFINYKERVGFLFFSTDFVVLLCLIIGIGILASDTINSNKLYGFCSMLLLLIPLIISIPVNYGYKGRGFPIRCMFLMDMAIILVITNLVMWVGIEVGKLGFNKRTGVIIILSFCLIVGRLDKFSIRNNKIVEISTDLLSGKVGEYYNRCKQINEYLEHQQGEVVIDIDVYPDPIRNLRDFGLTADKEFFANVDVAEYYGLESLRLSE